MEMYPSVRLCGIDPVTPLPVFIYWWFFLRNRSPSLPYMHLSPEKKSPPFPQAPSGPQVHSHV